MVNNLKQQYQQQTEIMKKVLFIFDVSLFLHREVEKDLKNYPTLLQQIKVTASCNNTGFL